MIKKFKIFGAVIAFALSATSCLDKYPDNAILAGDAITSLETANQAVIGIYSKFKSSSLYSGALTLLPDIQTDFVYAVQGYSNTYGDIWRWNDIHGTNNAILAVYGSLYDVIGSCNFFFQETEILEQKIQHDDDMLDQLNSLKAEVYFARALAYSELIKLFCKAYESDEEAEKELGVVLVDKYKSNEIMRRSSLKASYDFVLSDLANANELFGDSFEGQNYLYNAKYFTTGTINALYARLYLYMKKWNKAVEYSSKVIDSNMYKLSSTIDMYTSNYSYYNYMWTNDSSTEIIWRVAFETTSYGGALGRIFLNYDFTSYRPDYVPAEWVINLYENGDMRINSFFRNITTGYSHGLNWPLLIKYMGNDSFLANNILHVNMPKVFRLSEQYLIRAEANAELGKYSEAGKDITALRKARYNSYGTATGITATNWFDIISNERVKELYMEGFRLNDLKRWHKGFTRKAQQHTVAGGNTLKVPADDARFVWPIPQHELESPNADIEPNESNK